MIWVPLLATCIPACLAVGMVWRATTEGVAFTPDSVAYLQASRSFAAEGGLWQRADCGESHVRLTHYAPLYPVMLGVGIKAGWDPFAWGRVLNTLCAGVAVLAITLGALRLSGSAWAAMLSGCAVALLPQFVTNFRALLSEPPCT